MGRGLIGGPSAYRTIDMECNYERNDDSNISRASFAFAAIVSQIGANHSRTTLTNGWKNP